MSDPRWQAMVEARAERYMGRLINVHSSERAELWAHALQAAEQDCNDDVRHGRVPSEDTDR